LAGKLATVNGLVDELTAKRTPIDSADWKSLEKVASIGYPPIELVSNSLSTFP